jgi:hypothetical protein
MSKGWAHISIAVAEHYEMEGSAAEKYWERQRDSGERLREIKSMIIKVERRGWMINRK